MRINLMLKLMGAFAAVISIGALVISVMTSQATQHAFTLYTTRNGQIWAQQLASSLGKYYSDSGGWQDIEVYLQSSIEQAGETGSSGAGRGMGNGSGQGRGMGYGLKSGNGPGIGGGWALNQRLILANQDGQVIFDSEAKLVGSSLSPAQLDAGAPVLVNEQLVGTVIVSPSDLTVAGSPSLEFLSSVNRSIFTAVLIAGLIALALGALLVLQITSPLRQLKQAANAIAGGNLTQRVAVRSKDEFGELSSSFNQMAESLDKAETARKRLIADIAHELRTPLTVMQANLEGMIDEVLPLDSDQVQSLYEQSIHLNRLVSDLRLLSLAEAGELILERKRADLDALVRRAVDYIQPQASQQGINIEVDIQDDLLEVNIDADRITQVLNNLIANALRYTPPGKALVIRTQKLSSPDAGVRVSVIDPGPGISPRDLPNIFERFYRADTSRARSSGGTGLGLAIVKQLVEAHGGTVKATSPVNIDPHGQGFGTDVSFTLS